MAVTWASMMAAMMLPSALPAVVSLRRVARALAFAAGFLATWVAFGAVAFVAYHHSGLMDASRIVTVALVAAAVLYELTSLKRACLRRCRANAYEGTTLVRGARYGVDCIGCCAGLMLALFALDPMSMVWMLAVSALVFAQIVPAAARARAGSPRCP
jgi:predicted metal-binding membrane protein